MRNTIQMPNNKELQQMFQDLMSYYNQSQNPSVSSPQLTNPLSESEKEYLRKYFLKEEFNLTIPKVEKLQAKCTYRDNSGEKLLQNSDGTVTCVMCRSTFRPERCEKDELDNLIEKMVNVLETIKIMYMDIPNETVNKLIAVLIPNLKKVGPLYETAIKHYDMYSSQSIIHCADPSKLFSNGMNPDSTMNPYDLKHHYVSKPIDDEYYDNY